MFSFCKKKNVSSGSTEQTDSNVIDAAVGLKMSCSVPTAGSSAGSSFLPIAASVDSTVERSVLTVSHVVDELIEMPLAPIDLSSLEEKPYQPKLKTFPITDGRKFASKELKSRRPTP